MSGHSKWSTIKRKKAATDAKRGRIFTRLLREIQVAARMGGASIDGNPRLKAAVMAAKAQSVPGDNIEKAIGRGAGTMEGVDYEEVVYEAYGPGGVALLIKTLTENRNRTVAEVRFVLSRHNGSLAGANAVAYLFNEKGVCTLPLEAIGEDDLLNRALEGGAEDVQNQGDCWEITCEPGKLEPLRSSLEDLSPALTAEQRSIPVTLVKVSGAEAQTLMKLLNAMDDLDDVQDVVGNFDIDEKEMELYSE